MSRNASRLFPAVALACLFAAAAPHPARTAPVVSAPGWSVAAEVDSVGGPFAMAVDAATGDLYVLEGGPLPPGGFQLERIRAGGARDVLWIGLFTCAVPRMSFDPGRQHLYVTGCDGLRVFDANGSLLGADPVPAGTAVVGPDHVLYETVADVIPSPSIGDFGTVRIDALDEPALTRHTVCTTGASMFVWEQASLLAGPFSSFYVGTGTSWSPLACAPGASLGAAQLMGLRNALQDGVIYQTSGSSLVSRHAGPGAFSPFASGFGACIDVGAGPDGSLFVLDYLLDGSGRPGKVWRLSPAGATPAHGTTWGSLKAAYR